MKTSCIATLCLAVSGLFLVSFSAQAAVLSIDTTEPSTDVVLSNTGNSSYTRSFNDDRARGQTLLMPDAGDGCGAWQVTDLTFRKNSNQTFASGDELVLWVFEWNPADNGNTMSQWTTGDGLSDGDPLDGTSMGNLLVDAESFALPTTQISNGNYLHFDFSSSPLYLEENTTYGLLFEFLDANTSTGPTIFQLSLPQNGDSYSSGRLLTTTGTGLGSTSSQDLTFYVTATPVPEPSTFALFAAGLLGLGLLVRRKHGSP